MEKEIITIIIATYNRPDVLKTAIKCVINQSVKNWKLLVIGDCCDERTGKLVSSINDKRIKYINLPERFGEQSGPNSIGLALAQTPFIAFLNHDDLWLTDHLESGITFLENNEYDFYLGGTAFSRYLEYGKEPFEIHVDEINAVKRNETNFFSRSFKVTTCEPASSWILKKTIADKIGDWKYYSDIYRNPVEDFILNAWRLNASFYFSLKVTVWCFRTQNNYKGGNLYNYKSIEHQLAEEILKTNSSENVRTILTNKMSIWKGMDTKRRKTISKNTREKSVFNQLITKIMLNKYTAYLFKYTGIDILNVLEFLRKSKHGYTMKSAILWRTGTLPLKPNKDEIIRRLKIEMSES
jgi:glycosyltransferase involved in cell wall biosynthesis